MESKVVTLKQPITFGQDIITSLTIRPPKAKDFRKLPMDPKFGDILDLVSRLTAQPPAVIDELGADDLVEVAAIVEGFMPLGLGTGEKPSR